MDDSNDIKFHILTPFYRMENFDILIRRLKQADSWTCIVTKTEHFSAYGHFFKMKNASHIEYVCSDFRGDPAYCKINRYITENNKHINNNDYYMFVMDDDIIPNGFVEEVKKINAAVIFVSTHRGHKIPYRQDRTPHKTGKLLAHEKGVAEGRIWFCQMIVKGSVLKQMRFSENRGDADGMMAKWLKKHYPITYAPDLCSRFNYLEPGRWILPIL